MTLDPAKDGLYLYWRRALAGEKDLAISETDPQLGFYEDRNTREPNTRVPVAIWLDDDGVLRVNRGNPALDVAPIRDQNAIWTRVAKRPISAETYFAVLESGVWPDTAGLVEKADTMKTNVPGADGMVSLGHNSDGAEIDKAAELREKIDAAANLLDEVLKKPIADQATADRVANAKDRFRQLYNEAEAARDEEKKPHEDAVKKVRARWKPLLEIAEGAKERAVKAQTVWLKAEQARRDKERAEAEALAAKAAAEAEEARKAAEAAGAPPPPAPEPVEVPKATVARSGGAISGRKTGLKTVRTFAEVKDWKALMESLFDNDEMRATAQLLADRAARGGNALPGTVIKEEKSAV